MDRQTRLFASERPPQGVTSVEWYTPKAAIALVREVLGDIELDPLSCSMANQIVDAERFYDRDDDGMAKSWAARTVYVNPPTGLTKAAWVRLVEHYQAGLIGAAIWAMFSVEQLQTLQQAGAALSPTDLPMCVARSRIRWLRGDSAQTSLFNEPTVGTSPRNSSGFILFSQHEPLITRFARTFAQLGGVVVPRIELTAAV